MVNRQSRRIQAMFGSIAPRYDLLNRLLSLTIDRSWRRRAAVESAHGFPISGHVLDLCTGTADLALDLKRQLGDRAQVIGCDFCHPMLLAAARKIGKRRWASKMQLAEGDALRLPFRNDFFQVLTIAFGLRNLESYRLGLEEMFRVLLPGGRLAILEFSRPNWPLVGQLYRLYFHRILPWMGGLISGREGPYSYLPQSVVDFPEPEELSQLLRQIGFVNVRWKSLTAGIVTLYLARK